MGKDSLVSKFISLKISFSFYSVVNFQLLEGFKAERKELIRDRQDLIQKCGPEIVQNVIRFIDAKIWGLTILIKEEEKYNNQKKKTQVTKFYFWLSYCQ